MPPARFGHDGLRRSPPADGPCSGGEQAGVILSDSWVWDTFYSGTTVLGDAPVVGGAAALTTSALPAGRDSLRAYYGGRDSANLPVTSPTIVQQVNAVAAKTYVTSGPFPAGSAAFASVSADFNGDNWADIAVANAAEGSVTILMGDGKGGFTPSPASPFRTGHGPFALAAGDFNGDGRIDLAVANNSDNTLTVLLGDGAGGFTPAAGSP